MSNLFHLILKFLLSLLPHRVSVSCQIKKMEQPIHIGELISGTHTLKKPPTLAVCCIVGICIKFCIQISTSTFRTWHLLGF